MWSDPRFALLLLCFFLSGLAALIYQTAWTRQFAFVFGTSELAIATVLAAYMGGLATGAAAMGRLAGRIRRPVLVYGLLELGIAASALAVPAALRAATLVYVGIFGASELGGEALGLAHALFYLLASSLILLVPTGLMGATLPLLARHAVRRESEIGSRVGTLYATNTAGAVVGTLAAAFALLPRVGLEHTVHVAVGANALVFLAAAALARGAPAPPAVPPAAPAGASPGRWILPLVAVSGAVSFSYEVLWSRLIGQLLGGSVQGFATMLASFLVGIAGGSALAARLADHPARAARAFAWAQLGTGGLSLLAFSALDRMPAFSSRLADWSGAPLFADAVIAAATLLPGALCIGATFPLAVRVLARHEAEAARESARVYAWNTLGAIAGAVGAGFFLLPALGFAGMLTLAVASNATIALATALALPSGRLRLAGVAVAGLTLLALLRPQTPWNLLRASVFRGIAGLDRVVHYGVGRSATVLLGTQHGGWRLLTNGLPEAFVAPRGASRGGGAVHQWLGAIAGLARPEARRMLMIGLGGGAALAAVPSSFASIDVVEIEPEVIRANQAIGPARNVDPLTDPRVRLVVNDARGALLLAETRYDAIVSQPSHPWTAGASHLYTREFFELARERLTPSGVLVQWMGLRFVDADLLRTLIATLVDVFPHVRVYRPVSGALLFLASSEPLRVEENALLAIAAAPAEFAALGVYGPEDVAAGLALDEAGARALAAGTPINTDSRNQFAVRSLALVRDGASGSSAAELLSESDPAISPTLDRVALVRRLLTRRMPALAWRAAQASDDPAERATALGLVAAGQDRPRLARRRLEQALELDPDSREARAALLRVRRRSFLVGAPELAELAAALDPADAAVLEGWRREAQSDWSGLQALEPELLRSSGRDPLFPDALRLRIGWRLASPDAARAAEALALADSLVAASGDPRDWLLHARAAAAAGHAGGALASLFEIASRLGPAPPHRRIAGEALALLYELRPALDPEWDPAGVEARLRRPLGGGAREALAADPGT